MTEQELKQLMALTVIARAAAEYIATVDARRSLVEQRNACRCSDEIPVRTEVDESGFQYKTPTPCWRTAAKLKWCAGCVQRADLHLMKNAVTQKMNARLGALRAACKRIAK